METKTCKKCEGEYPLSDYHVAARNVGGREHICKHCRLSRKKELRTDEWREREWEKNLRYNYDLSKYDYDRMAVHQNNVCIICENKDDRKLSVDHCHETGKVRGLLCNSCNRSIGMLGDSVDSIKKVLNYLENPPAHNLLY